MNDTVKSKAETSASANPRDIATTLAKLVENPSPELIRAISSQVEIRLAGYFAQELSLEIELIKAGGATAEGVSCVERLAVLNRMRSIDVVIAPALIVDDYFLNAERAFRKAESALADQESEREKLAERVEPLRLKKPDYLQNQYQAALRERSVIQDYWEITGASGNFGGTPGQLAEGMEFLKNAAESGRYLGKVSMKGSKLRFDELRQMLVDVGREMQFPLKREALEFLAADEGRLLDMADKISSLKGNLIRCQQSIQKMTTGKVDALKVALARVNALIDCRDLAAAHGGELAI